MISRPVGLRRVLAVGSSDGLRPVHVPTLPEIESVIKTLRASDSDLDRVVAELVAFLYLTGVRVGGALALRARDLIRLTDGSAWVYVPEKLRRDRRPERVRPESAAIAIAWATLPPDAPLWSVRGRRLAYERAHRALARGCDAAGVTPFARHGLRRAFARDLFPALGLRGVMSAVGWSVMEHAEHYLDRAGA